MKKYIFILLAILGAFAYSSCHRENISGTWTGVPTPINVPEAYLASSQMTLEFLPDPGASYSGQIVLRSFIDMQQATAATLEQNDQISYAISVAGTASISGTYTIHDGDEVRIVLDPSTMSVSVDPDAVHYTSDFETSAQSPEMDQVRPQTAMKISKMLEPIMAAEFSKFQTMDDVHIEKGTVMTCEVAHKDLTFHLNN